MRFETDQETPTLTALAKQFQVRHGTFWLEVLALLAILLLALFLRLWNLVGIPPGFHFDEAADLKIGLDVANGARPLYVSEGWGREGLYYYLVALML